MKLSKAIRQYLVAVREQDRESDRGQYCVSPSRIEIALMHLGKSIADALNLPKPSRENRDV